MFLNHSQIAPARMTEILGAAETAARRVPPAFPLEATVAVNPFLGQTGEDLATAAMRLSRVAGIDVMQPRSAYAAKVAAGDVTDADLSDALSACTYPEKPADLTALKACLAQTVAVTEPLPTVAELAAGPSDTDWSGLVARCLGLWAAGHFDQGQALWTPAPGRTAFAAWREWASHDLTPELAGLKGFGAHVAACPDTAERAILRAADTLGLTESSAEGVFHRLYVDMGGWSQHARWLLWQAELAGETDVTLSDLLAIRLVWEEALYLQEEDQIAPRWRQVLDAHAAPVAPNADQIADMILQEAAERAHQRKLAAKLTGAIAPASTRPALQAAFCIDVRSEVFRRSLEPLSSEISTIGFAGFFGLPMAHRSTGSDIVNAHLPVLLNAAMHSSDDVAPEFEESTRIAARAARAWGRFRQAAVSSFAFVEAAGPPYAGKLIRDAFGMSAGKETLAPAPQPDTEMSADAKADTTTSG
ncbi:MAG: putative inorganic carbon transporter subunit DabA, partial [Arenibacterium sp.]